VSADTSQHLPNVRPEGAEVRAALIDLDALFDEQLQRISRKLERVGSRLDEAAAESRRLSLIEAYTEAETLSRLAQIAENSGRVVLPGLDQYDDKTHAPNIAGGITAAVDTAAKIRRSHAVMWAANPKWKQK
jgi:hypothetical protein